MVRQRAPDSNNRKQRPAHRVRACSDRREKHMDNFNDSKALAIEIAKILDKKKAQDVRVLKVESLTVLTD